jgi:hypothetical protein
VKYYLLYGNVYIARRRGLDFREWYFNGYKYVAPLEFDFRIEILLAINMSLRWSLI